MTGDAYHAGVTWLDAPAAQGDGPLAGRRLLVKDLIDTAGVRTTYGSSIYAGHVPSATAPAVTRLLDAGAAMVGKANLHEFAWGVTSQNPWYGTVRNPARPGRTAGGSSGGNAAALAAGLCDLGLGTDTGGSIRLPAACCGVVGLKPRWGAVPLDGVYPLCPTFDTVGPLAGSVTAVAQAWAVLTSRDAPEPALAGLTVGVLRRPPSVGDGVRPEPSAAADEAAGRLERLGARLVEAVVPEPPGDTWPLFYWEAARSHDATFPSRAAEYGDNVRAKLERARQIQEPAAAEAREAVASWRRLQPDVDLYVSPCVTGELPPEDCEELEVRIRLTAWLRWVNVLGWAALAIGNVQLIAPHDETVLAAGLAFEDGAGS